METSSEILDVVVRLIDNEKPHFFSNKMFKKAYKHPMRSELKKIANEILEVSNDFDIDTTLKLSEVKRLGNRIQEVWAMA